MPLQIRRRPRVDDSHLPATLHPLLRQIFASRGVEDPALLERSASQLLPPQRLFGMEQAVPLLADALTAQQRILIVGDFDCDGATSSALCVLALRAMGGHHVDFLVPNRFEFGYGLTPEIVELAVA
ncbi:MAG: single-stranded-DNA-specific exonuclease RecJ, partial [Aeromonas sp.]|nr:single-stranded-DNA-specific exonuclease RecJ [Aeromonas sp.]